MNFLGRAVALVLVGAFSTLTITPPSALVAKKERKLQARGHSTSLHLTSGDRVTIPLELHSDCLWMRGAIHSTWTRGRRNGSDSVSILLDTGAYGDMIDRGRAETIGLAFDERIRLATAGGIIEGRMTQRVTVASSGFELRNDQLYAVPLESLSAEALRDVEVIVGHPLFGQGVVSIDYQQLALEVTTSRAFVYRGTGTVLPLVVENGLPCVTARIRLPGRDPIEGLFLLDTGFSGALLLEPAFVEQHGILEAVGTTIADSGAVPGGQIRVHVGRLPNLEIGGVRLDRPIVVIPASGLDAVKRSGIAGVIGGSVLRRFRTIFDYGRGQVILEPGPSVGEPFEYDMSGIRLRAAGPGRRTLEIAGVRADSPAHAVGLRAGDEIVAVEGRSPVEFGYQRLIETFRRPGERVRLGVRRAGENLETSLETRRMLE